jgi:hypothetical protein
MRTQALARLSSETARPPARKVELLPWHQQALTILKPRASGYEYLTATSESLQFECDSLQLNVAQYQALAQHKLILFLRSGGGMLNVRVLLKEW